MNKSKLDNSKKKVLNTSKRSRLLNSTLKREALKCNNRELAKALSRKKVEVKSIADLFIKAQDEIRFLRSIANSKNKNSLSLLFDKWLNQMKKCTEDVILSFCENCEKLQAMFSFCKEMVYLQSLNENVPSENDEKFYGLVYKNYFDKDGNVKNNLYEELQNVEMKSEKKEDHIDKQDPVILKEIKKPVRQQKVLDLSVIPETSKDFSNSELNMTKKKDNSVINLKNTKNNTQNSKAFIENKPEEQYKQTESDIHKESDEGKEHSDIEDNIGELSIILEETSFEGSKYHATDKIINQTLTHLLTMRHDVETSFDKSFPKIENFSKENSPSSVIKMPQKSNKKKKNDEMFDLNSTFVMSQRQTKHVDKVGPNTKESPCLVSVNAPNEKKAEKSLIPKYTDSYKAKNSDKTVKSYYGNAKNKEKNINHKFDEIKKGKLAKETKTQEHVKDETVDKKIKENKLVDTKIQHEERDNIDEVCVNLGESLSLAPENVPVEKNLPTKITTVKPVESMKDENRQVGNINKQQDKNDKPKNINQKTVKKGKKKADEIRKGKTAKDLTHNKTQEFNKVENCCEAIAHSALITAESQHQNKDNVDEAVETIKIKDKNADKSDQNKDAEKDHKENNAHKIAKKSKDEEHDEIKKIPKERKTQEYKKSENVDEQMIKNPKANKVIKDNKIDKENIDDKIDKKNKDVKSDKENKANKAERKKKPFPKNNESKALSVYDILEDSGESTVCGIPVGGLEAFAKSRLIRRSSEVVSDVAHVVSAFPTNNKEDMENNVDSTNILPKTLKVSKNSVLQVIENENVKNDEFFVKKDTFEDTNKRKCNQIEKSIQEENDEISDEDAKARRTRGKNVNYKEKSLNIKLRRP